MDMNLSDYIKLERGNGKALAEKLGISQSLLSQIAADSSATAPARCVLIEQCTGGAVTRRDLRPADWQQIWPELERRSSGRQEQDVNRALGASR
jgi:DNA-binding transcriptional regulator YdaS (Cro superfamily)